MLYRAAMVLVAVFWAAMWALLIRAELRPHEGGLREVPPELVLKQVFQQEQTSELVVRSGGTRVGHLRATPKLDPETGAKSLELLGSLQVEIPGAPPNQHASWQLALEMDPQFSVQRLRANVVVRPSGFRSVPLSTLNITMDPPQKRGHFRLAFGDDPPLERDITLDEAGLQALLREWGVDQRMLAAIGPARMTVAPEITSRLAKFATHNEQLETYLITAQNQGQTLVEMHVSQLGQILHAKTLLGWEFAAE